MRLFLVSLLIPLLIACSSPTPEAPPEGAIETAVAATVAAQPAPTTIPTSPPEPSPTIEPTAEPSPTTAEAPTVTVVLVEATPTVELEIIVTDPLAIIATFKTAGLEAESPSVMGPEDYGVGPYVGKGIHFLIPSLCPECGGRAFVFDNAADLAALEAYYVEAGRSSALLFSHVYRRGNLLVQLNGDLPAEQAEKYKAALEQVR